MILVFFFIITKIGDFYGYLFIESPDLYGLIIKKISSLTIFIITSVRFNLPVNLLVLAVVSSTSDKL